MHPQLEILLQIQDLRSQRQELAESQEGREIEATQFHVDIDEALKKLDEKVAEMEQELTPHVRNRYQRIAAGRGRVIVPVINGTCYGCFVAIPTALLSELGENDDVRHCDNCGRFLYVAQ